MPRRPARTLATLAVAALGLGVLPATGADAAGCGTNATQPRISAASTAEGYTVGATIHIRGALVRLGCPLAGQRVELRVRYAPGVFSPLLRTATDSTGRYGFALKAQRSLEYEVLHAATSSTKQALSQARHIDVTRGTAPTQAGFSFCRNARVPVSTYAPRAGLSIALQLDAPTVRSGALLKGRLVVENQSDTEWRFTTVDDGERNGALRDPASGEEPVAEWSSDALAVTDLVVPPGGFGTFGIVFRTTPCTYAKALGVHPSSGRVDGNMHAIGWLEGHDKNASSTDTKRWVAAPVTVVLDS